MLARQLNCWEEKLPKWEEKDPNTGQVLRHPMKANTPSKETIVQTKNWKMQLTVNLKKLMADGLAELHTNLDKLQ